MNTTVLGGSGFIGAALLKRLAAEGVDVYAPPRDGVDWSRELGHVVYAIGFTADFRDHPIETVDAHVTKLAETLRRGRFESLTYLSSTRVYRGTSDTREPSPLCVHPAEPSDLYNASKLLGESLCFAAAANTRVVRLANVYGFDPDSDNFLASVLRDSALHREVRLRSALDSSKDYIAIGDAVEAIVRVATSARARLYNVASGRNVTHREIVEVLGGLGVRVSVEPAASAVVDPVIQIDRIVEEFGFTPQPLLPALPKLYAKYEGHFGAERALGGGA